MNDSLPAGRKPTRLQLYCRLNEAHFFGGKIYYRRSLAQLGRLAGRQARSLKRRGHPNREGSLNALERIRTMVASRQGVALFRGAA